MTLKRNTIRFKNFDYSFPWVYFITICTYKKRPLLGWIKNNKMHYNVLGYVVDEELNKSINIRKEIEIKESVIMPNHLHMIIFLHKTFEINKCAVINNSSSDQMNLIPFMKPHSISSFISGFKSAVNSRLKRRINNKDETVIKILNKPPFYIKDLNRLNFWQRNYFDHIIKNEKDYMNCVNYIRNNPKNWFQDKYNV
ncbi:MAG: hypothetical protein PHV06_04050 [bacterium]|nr:hypothetical protein [bacterium]